MVHDAHRERVRELGQALPDAAEPEDSKRAPSEIVRRAGFVRGLPLAGAQSLLGLREEAEGGDKQVERGCGRGVVYGTGGIGDEDTCEESVSVCSRAGRATKYSLTSLFAGGNVDLIIASSVVCNPLESAWELRY